MALRPGLIRMVLEADGFVSNGDRVNRTLKNIEGAAKNTTEQVNKVESSLKSNIGTASRYATTLATTAFAAKNLGDMQLDLAKAAKKVDEAQDRVNKLLRENKKGTDDYNDAIRDLSIAQENQSQVTDRVNESYIMFGLTLSTTAANAIPAVISGIKNMGGAIKLLDLATSKYVLIALGLIAAFEGIAHIIKLINPEIDITLEKLSGDLFNAVTKSTESVNTGTDSLSNYRSEMNLVGTEAQQSATKLTNLGTVIDLTNSKMNDLKKNNDNLDRVIEEFITTYVVPGGLLSVAEILIQQAENSSDPMERLQKYTEAYEILRQRSYKKTPSGADTWFRFDISSGKAIPIDLSLPINQVLGRNISGSLLHGGFITGYPTAPGQVRLGDASALSTDQIGRIIRYSRQYFPPTFVQNLETRLRQLQSVSQKNTLENMIYNLKNPSRGLAGFQGKNATAAAQGVEPGTPMHILIAAAEADRIENERRRLQKNPYGYWTSQARVSRTISELLSPIPQWMIGPLGSDRSVILNNAQRARAEYDRLVNELAEYGLGIPGPTMIGRGGKGHVPFYANDAAQNLAKVMEELARRKEARLSPYRGLGYSDSAILSMLSTGQGVEDLTGMKLAKQLASLA